MKSRPRSLAVGLEGGLEWGRGRCRNSFHDRASARFFELPGRRSSLPPDVRKCPRLSDRGRSSQLAAQLRLRKKDVRRQRPAANRNRRNKAKPASAAISKTVARSGQRGFRRKPRSRESRKQTQFCTRSRVSERGHREVEVVSKRYRKEVLLRWIKGALDLTSNLQPLTSNFIPLTAQSPSSAAGRRPPA